LAGSDRRCHQEPRSVHLVGRRVAARDYKQSEHGKVIVPLTVLRRLDCVLEATKAKVLDRTENVRGNVDNIEPVLCSVSGEQFFNTSPLDFRCLLDDPSQIAGNLCGYIVPEQLANAT
jgi:type I restriction enzyme M protein